MKIFDTFTDLFSNIDVDSIRETYPKICVYNKVIAHYVEETNIKYGLNFKFTKLEALEVVLWAKSFQVAGHDEDQQPPEEEQSEPLKPQTTILTSKPPVTKQQVETDQMTSMVARWSCSTPVLSPMTGERNGQHMQQAGQYQHDVGYTSI